MKRASYRHAVQWIAENDETAEMQTDVIQDFVSVLLIADIFEVEPSRVAKDVQSRRRKFFQGDS